jgi:hypothetical protein
MSKRDKALDACICGEPIEELPESTPEDHVVMCKCCGAVIAARGKLRGEMRKTGVENTWGNSKKLNKT